MPATKTTLPPVKKIALIAHDHRKRDLIEWARFNRGTLSKHTLFATGTTGRVLAEELGLPVTRLQSGPIGGDQQIGAMIVDGAGPWRRYWSLALPLARPALATTVIFAFLGTWDEFAWALTVLNDTDVRTLPIAISLFQGQHSTSWGLVFAASMIAIVPVLIVYIVFQRFFVAGLTTGAVKG